MSKITTEKYFLVMIFSMIIFTAFIAFFIGSRYPGPIRIHEPEVYENFIQQLESIERVTSYSIHRNKVGQSWMIIVQIDDKIDYRFESTRDWTQLEKQIEDLKRFINLI